MKRFAPRSLWGWTVSAWTEVHHQPSFFINRRFLRSSIYLVWFSLTITTAYEDLQASDYTSY